MFIIILTSVMAYAIVITHTPKYVLLSFQIDGSDGHYKLTLDGILQIVGLVREDAGIYICVAANGIGDPIKKEFNVVVKGESLLFYCDFKWGC